jgi:type I restriction enzyme M protein
LGFFISRFFPNFVADKKWLIMDYKNLLKAMGFSPKENVCDVFAKKYSPVDNYCLEVDFEKNTIDYGNLIRSDSKTTQNFSQPENFVVLECINRLLEKGYRPENIVLEKTWNAGHGTSGRLDICVTRGDDSEYLLIECKTCGKEFDKELARMKKDGGQLFTYFKFSNKADIIMLYASELKSKEIIYRNEIIKIEDDYRTGDVKDFYERWNKQTKDNGVFEHWVRPYNFESKALTPENLKGIRPEDSSLIFNQFLEILRHNVVSDKPNAFNKIFTLFLCKIFDEKNTKPNEELAFQWFYTPYQYGGISYPPDNHISFQKRLTDLYKKGMKEFLEKEVTDISDVEFEKKYGILRDDVRKQLLDELTEIRLKKNNEFAIKEVFDNDSFEENAKVVKEVVELLQKYKIRYAAKQQYLSDFFELLLTTGLKQESGQYFTPVPLAQFIIKSLPIDKIVQDKLEKGVKDEYLPHIIDYAAGSGHFVTESMHILQQLLDNTDSGKLFGDAKKFVDKAKDYPYDWATDYVYGIEKDYRLVKVGKVGCYLHGDGLARVIHSDGLGNFKKTKEYKGLLTKTDKDFPQENKQFDMLVSNPPYSVSAFKNNASKFYSKDDFELYDSLTDNSSEIECLFVERTGQLLKDGGVAGIILPTAILNSTGIYTKTRALLLRNFEIISIVELGVNTFMATKIRTVILFLRRRNNYDSMNLKKSVDKFFADFHDITLNGIEKAFSQYINCVWGNLSFDSYVSLLKNRPGETGRNHEIYQEYRKKIKTKNEEVFNKAFVELEKEKIFYFILTYPQKTVLIKTGDKEEEKAFLGYEFSERDRKEGVHSVVEGKEIDECTQLFDIERFDNPQKASTYIYKSFNGQIEDIHADLQQNIEYVSLNDLINFQTSAFDLKIEKTQKININYTAIWESDKTQYLSNVALVEKGKSITKLKTTEGNIPVIAGGKAPAYFHNEANRDGNIVTISASGAYSGFVNYFDVPIFASDCNTVKSLNETEYPTKLIYYCLKVLQSTIYKLQRGQAQPHVYKDDIEKIKIPVFDKWKARQILAEIETLEKKAKTVVIENFDGEIEIILKK